MASKFESDILTNDKAMAELMKIIEDLLTGRESVRSLAFWARVARLIASAWGDDLWQYALSGRYAPAVDTYGEDKSRAVILTAWSTLTRVFGAVESEPDTEISKSERADADKLISDTRPPIPVNVGSPPGKPGSGGVAGNPLLATLAKAGGTVTAGYFGGPAAADAASEGFKALGMG
jgi:hypothetical protein